MPTGHRTKHKTQPAWEVPQTLPYAPQQTEGLLMTSQPTFADICADAVTLAEKLDRREAWKLAQKEQRYYRSVPARALLPSLWSNLWSEPDIHVAQCDALVIAETHNQGRALRHTVEESQKLGVRTTLWGAPEKAGIEGANLWVDPLERTHLKTRIASTIYRQRHPKDLAGSAAYTAEALYALVRSQAQTLVVSNDHSALPYHSIQAARHLGIPSLYLQHAPVGPYMPPLAVDVACLDGWRSFEIYARTARTQACAHRPVVVLTGKQETPKPSTGDRVGVAVNTIDTPDGVARFLDGAIEPAHRVLLRTHPRMAGKALDVWRTAIERHGWEWSNPLSETPEAFLHNVHTLYAGVSGIFLEAALAGVANKQWTEADGTPKDYYGFQAGGIVAYGSQPAKKAAVSDLRSWSETFGTPHQGKEGQLVAQMVHDCARSGRVSPQDRGYIRHDPGDGWVVWSLP